MDYIICSLDSVAYGAVSWFSLYAVFFAYGASFLSRRLLIEHRGISFFLYALFTAFGVLIYQVGTPLLFRSPTLMGLAKDIAAWSVPTGSILIFSIIFASLLFPLVYFVLKRFESHIEALAQRQFLNVR